MALPAYLGIDIGTTGIRASCIDDQADQLCSEQIAFKDNAVHDDGIHEQQPARWLAQLERLLSATSISLRSLDQQYHIKAISIDGTSGTLIACQQDGTPLSPALMYNDQRSQQQAHSISRFAPADSAVHGASSSLAKALFLRQQFPETKLFCHQADWLGGSLTGVFGVSDENNCLKLGYDSRTGCWPAWLQNNDENVVIPVELLPQVVAAGSRLCAIKQDYIDRYQLAADCCLVAGTTDSNAAVLATGASEPGDAVTALGSTLVIKLFSDKPLFKPEYGIYSHRLNSQWLLGGASNSGGNVLLQHFSLAQIEAMTSRLNPDQETGLDYYPLPSTGERFPINDSEKQSIISPRPESDVEFFQGLLEGIAGIEADGYNKLVALGATPPQRIFTTGGGNRNPAWKKIRERICKTEVIDAAHDEASYGSALLAKSGVST